MIADIRVPNEVYLVALDLIGQERPADPADAESVLLQAEGRNDYHQPSLTCPAGKSPVKVTGFGAALAMFVSLSGPFSEDGGEFAGVSGWRAA